MIPDDWRKAVINLIPKESGRIIDPLKYRGISLQSCVYKVFSNIINNRVITHLEHDGLLAEEQNGFRKKRSCEQHIFTLVTLIKNNLVSKKSVYTTFVDFRKTFDVTNRQLLYYKLLKGGVNGPIFEIIRQIYQNTTSVMRLNGYLSNELSTTQGSRQGDNLSPCLFNYYINGLIETLRESNEGVHISERRNFEY